MNIAAELHNAVQKGQPRKIQRLVEEGVDVNAKFGKVCFNLKPVLDKAKNKGAEQPAHVRSMARTFVVLCIGSKFWVVSFSESLRLFLVSELSRLVYIFTVQKLALDT